MEQDPLTEPEIARLYDEREKIEDFLTPAPEPPETVLWKKKAKERLQEIDSLLVPYFFPKPKEEGTQRKTKNGYVVMLKTGLDRIIDLDALPAVVKKLPKGTEDKVVDWKASLKLKEYKNLPEKTRDILEGALIVRPKKAEFEIVKQPD